MTHTSSLERATTLAGPSSLAIAVVICLVPQLIGCHAPAATQFQHETAASTVLPVAYNQVDAPDVEVFSAEAFVQAPLVFGEEPPAYWTLTLEQAIHIALSNSEVLRSLGGQATIPGRATTVYDPALSATDPRQGVQAALSAFDAQLGVSSFWLHNDRGINNVLLGGLDTAYEQDLVGIETEVSKVAATGTSFSFKNQNLYDANDQPIRGFPSAWDAILEAGVRHPLGQGGGIQFNRIAGPNARPGLYKGVLLARTNTEITLADFELSVRKLVNEIERTYWQLFLAYHNLDAVVESRNAVLEIWRAADKKYQEGQIDGEEVARAREQYYLVQTTVLDALGATTTATDTIRPVTPAFLPVEGVHTLERRFRYLLGLPTSDGRMIRPAAEPVTAEVTISWEESVAEALLRRVEVRRQRTVIKRREFELIAARNFLKPRLDIVGNYRLRGFGDELLRDTPRRLGSAYEELFSGEFHEWVLGFQYTRPIGNRIGHTTLRNAELALARERAVLLEQERKVVEEANAAFTGLSYTYAVLQAANNRRLASWEQLGEIRKKYEEGFTPLEFLLDAEARAAEAGVVYYRSLVNYQQAIANIYVARGQLLEHHDVFLVETLHFPVSRRSIQPLDYSLPLDRVVPEETPVSEEHLMEEEHLPEVEHLPEIEQS